MDPSGAGVTAAITALAGAGDEGRVARPPLSWAYRVSLVFVTGVVLVLPLLYCGFVVAGFAWIHRHVVAAALHLELGWVGTWMAYMVPTAITIACTVFLLKPFVAPRPLRVRAQVLTRGREPELFAFVEALCRLVGAPVPRTIEVTCDVNAEADFRHGIRSLRDADLVLSIGLPLAAGLDLRSFTGVLTHELGHFSQRAGLRLHHLVRVMNLWFRQVVYEPDAWDRTLTRLVSVPWRGMGGVFLLMLAALATGVISLSRLVLWPLMLTARVLSSALLRQLELDADRLHVQVVGSETFRETVLRLAMLREGTRQAALSLEHAWAVGRLGDDLTALIVDHADELDESDRTRVVEQLMAERSEWSDPHPDATERVLRALEMDREGVLSIDGPATQLFGDFGRLARLVTLSEYQARLGDEVSGESLVATGWVHAQRAQLDVFEQAVLRYFGVPLEAQRPLSLGLAWIAPPTSVADERRAIAEARGSMRQAAIRVRACIVLREGDDFERQVAELTMAELEDLASRRLGAALKLVELGGGLERVAEPDRMRLRARELRVALVVFEAILPKFCELCSDRRELERLGAQVGYSSQGEWAMKKLTAMAPRVALKLGALRAPLTQHAYPYPHATEGISIGRYALESLPDMTDPATVLETTQQLIERLMRFYTRVLGELAQIAEAVERAVDLAPLDLRPGREIGDESSTEAA